MKNRQQFDPGRRDFAPYGFTCGVWKLQTMPRADRHNEIELNLPGEYGFTYLMGGRREQMKAGRLALFWAATPHQIVEFTGRCTYHVATVPLAWFLGWGLAEPLVQEVLAGGVVRAADSAQKQGDRRLFTQWERDFAEASPERLRIAALEVEARVRRLALGYRKPASARRLDGPVDKIESMAAWIARSYTGPVRLADIGRAVGLHPNYAAGLFHKAFGTTINAYVIAHRVAHAQRLLMTSEEKVLAVALASGFNTLSRFNEAFRRACGCTPREYRRRHRVG